MALKKSNIIFAWFVFILCFAYSCKDGKIDLTKYGNCTDRIQNQNEEGVDCGGVCAPCSSCNDGIKNQGETGIDCGGPCQSCSPGCSVAASTLRYTFDPSQSPDSCLTYGNAFFSSSNSQIEINFTGGIMNDMTITFLENFNPLTYIPVNETMIFTTVNYSDISYQSQVSVTYNTTFTYDGMEINQLIYITKTSATKGIIKFCNLKSGNKSFSLNAILQ